MCVSQVRRWFHLWRLLCHYFFVISSSLGASGRLWCFVILEFLGHLIIFLREKKSLPFKRGTKILIYINFVFFFFFFVFFFFFLFLFFFFVCLFVFCFVLFCFVFFCHCFLFGLNANENLK